MRFRPGALALLGVLVTLAGTVAPAAADESYPTPGDGSFSVVGRGWGHGRGMSQWGAYRAGQLGATAGQILAFYYSTSTAGSFGDRTLRVQLSASEGDRLVGFHAQAGLVATVYAADQRTVLGTRGLTDHSGWRVVTDAAGLKVQWQDGPEWTDVAIGGRTAFADGALVDVRATGTLPVADEDGGSRTYRGSYRVSRLDAARIRTVNHVPLDAGYLPSVVPAESPASWPAAALQAQAVAARSYAAWYEQHPQAGDYDLCDTTSCQVYPGLSSEDTRATAAVRATTAAVRTAGGAVVRTEFSSSNGGSVSEGGTGHSPARYDPWSDGSWDPRHTWSVDVPAGTAAAAVFGPGAVITEMRVTDRNGYGDWGGQVRSVTFTGVAGGSAVTRTMTGQEVRSAFGLNSALFSVRNGSSLRWQQVDGLSASRAAATFTYGSAGAPGRRPLAGDWNADGRDTPGVLTVVDGAWRWQLTDSNELGSPTFTFSFGPQQCIPVSGSWDGAGADRPGVVCPQAGQWLWRLRNATSGGAPTAQFLYGPTSCAPVTGDWNGDGRDTPGLVCATAGEFRWRLSNVNGTSTPAYDFRYGPASAEARVGDWNGDGRTTIGVLRPVGGRWLWSLRDANSTGPATVSFGYGIAGAPGVPAQAPISGDWNGDGTSTPGLVS